MKIIITAKDTDNIIGLKEDIAMRLECVTDIIRIDTADVVPKSEVERAYQRGFERGKRDNVCGFSAEDIAQKAENIAIDLEAMRTAANSYKMHYENARAEVAREIFEEIEQWLGNYNGCRVITYEKFDELKKKYTEDKK